MTPTSGRRFVNCSLLFPAAVILVVAFCVCSAAAQENWYTQSFYLLHEDHHTSDAHEVGRDADPVRTAELINLSKPDVIQIHAKGNPGWTTYPTEIGHTPPKLRRDVMGVWCGIADKFEYPFSAYYNIGRDGEIMQRRPEWNRSDARGKEIERALCYHSGVAEGYLWPMVGEIMEHYHPDGWWFDGSCFTVRLCYCPKCRDRFQREVGEEAPHDSKDPNWGRYHHMQRQIYREFVRETAKMIHRRDSACLVAVNWAYSLRMPEEPDEGLAYLTGDIGNRVEGLSAEAHWYDGTDVPFDLMTQLSTMHAQDVAGGTAARSRFGPKPPVQLQQEMAIVVANGGRFWVWDNPTPESGLVAARHGYLARHVKPWLDARRQWCLGTDRLPDVSLLNTAEAHYAVTDAAGPVCFNRRNNRIEGAAELLPRLHLNYEMIGDWRLHAQDIRSGVVIVEHPKKLSSRTARSLADFVRGGGTLLMSGMGPSAGGELVRELCGVSRIIGPPAAEQLKVEQEGSWWTFAHHLFRVTLDGAETVIATSDAQGQRQPLLTRNAFGNGAVYYFATPLLSQHGSNRIPDGLLQAVFAHVVPDTRRLLLVEAPTTVEVVLRKKGAARIVHLVNMAPGTRQVFSVGTRKYVNISALEPPGQCTIRVRVPGRPNGVVLQPQNVALQEWEYRDGMVIATIPSFETHQMVVLE